MEINPLQQGARLSLHVDSIAHGGEGVARTDGIVVFIQGAIPGDTIDAELVDVKKRFARARVLAIAEPSSHRVEQRCPAAAAGAGCCDFGAIHPEYEAELKQQILRDQLIRIGKLSSLPDIEFVELAPNEGWRTRFRLGVDAQGRAGHRAWGTNDVVVDKQCAQAPGGLLTDVIGAQKPFTAGAEVVVALDSAGNRSIVETKKAARGRSVSQVTRHISGARLLQEHVGQTTFEVDALSFWQAHSAAPEAYSDTARQWLSEAELPATSVVWDLYGGVGMLAPAILDAVPEGKVISVELSAQCKRVGAQALKGKKVEFVTADVAAAIPHLHAPQAVVLDPPRKGAGTEVIARIAAAGPEAVIHVGCDPATFARDIAAWASNGYQLMYIRQFNAFPGTHHSETFGFLTRD